MKKVLVTILLALIAISEVSARKNYIDFSLTTADGVNVSVLQKKKPKNPDGILVFELDYSNTESCYYAEFEDGMVFKASVCSIFSFVNISMYYLDRRHYEELSIAVRDFYKYQVPNFI